MVKILFSGKLGSGKDTAANYLISTYGGENLKFAGALYELQAIVQNFCGFPNEKDGWLLQTLGTNYARAKDPDVWVKLALQRAETIPANNNQFFTDARFPNEVESAKKAGFYTVRIKRRSDLRMVNLGNRDPSHPSETALDDCDCLFDTIIHNNEGLLAFLREIDAIYQANNQITKMT
jgi:hypothetical protein